MDTPGVASMPQLLERGKSAPGSVGVCFRGKDPLRGGSLLMIATCILCTYAGEYLPPPPAWIPLH